MKETHPLSVEAKDLLERLKNGSKDIAVPSVYPGATGAMKHAKAFLSNACHLSRNGRKPDFQIFGVLYGLRHGVEIFLKCLYQNLRTDNLLVDAFRGAALDDLLTWLTETNEEDGKVQAKQLLAALSVIRNIDVDNIKAPFCWTKNQATMGDRRFADQGLRILQQNDQLPRYTLASLWTPACRTHNLLSVFDKVETSLRDMHRATTRNAEQVGVEQPVPVDTIAATCELFEHWDPNGHAIRYASSSGAGSAVTVHGWNAHLPPLSLGALGELASELDGTVNAYDALLTVCYTHATLRSPHPSYESFLY